MKQLLKNVWGEAKVALAGPILGTLGALGVWVAGEASTSSSWIALAFTGFFRNLFNLLPVSPLDGAAQLPRFIPRSGSSGSSVWPGWTFLWPNPILILILVLGGLEVAALAGAQRPRGGLHYRVRPWQRVAVGTVYFGPAAFSSLRWAQATSTVDL